MGITFCKNDDTISLQANSRGGLSEGDCTACLVGWQTGSREGWLYKAIPCTNLDNYDNLLDNILTADDKQIRCELIKDINGYINKKWTGAPMTVQEIEQVFGSDS
jgi:hypothetical protein